MFNLLANYKTYLLLFVLLTTLIYIGLLKHQNTKLEGQLQLCNANLASTTAAIKIANDLRADQERKLRLREQEAAQARAESLKRKDNIMHKVINGGCEGAIQFMRDAAYQFTWDNNIP